jgi:hypothetical protein
VLKDGSQLLEVMSLEEIEKVRKVSRAANNGPWVSWWGEMARKTVMRRLSKRLPMSTDLEDEVFSRDETMRTNLLVAVADQIVRGADLQLKAVTILANHGARVGHHLTMLEDRQPPALTAVPASIWCDQCETMVAPGEAARCKSEHCKAKAAA